MDLNKIAHHRTSPMISCDNAQMFIQKSRSRFPVSVVQLCSCPRLDRINAYVAFCDMSVIFADAAWFRARVSVEGFQVDAQIHSQEGLLRGLHAAALIAPVAQGGVRRPKNMH